MSYEYSDYSKFYGDADLNYSAWHTDKCAECPAKKHAETAEKEQAANGGIVESMKRHAGIVLWIITALVAVILKLTGATAPPF